MRKSRFQAQGLIFGGLMAALVVIFAAVPFLSFFMPLPIVLVYLRHGGRTAGLTGVVSALFAMLMLPPTAVLLQVVPIGIMPGLAMGLAYTRKWKPFLAGALVATLFFLGMAGDYAVTRVMTFGGRDPLVAMLEVEPMRSKAAKAFDDATAALAKIEPKTEQEAANKAKLVARLEEIRQNPIPTIWAMLPVFVAAAAALFAWIHLLLTARLLPRFGYAPPEATPFGELRLPTWVSLGYFGLVLGMQVAIQKLPSIPWWMDLVQGAALGLLLLIMVVAIAIAYGYLRRKSNLTKGIAVLVALLAVMLLNQWAVILVMWDAIFDFRGLGHGTRRQTQPES